MSTPALELQHISKRFGTETVLDDVCLTLAEGQTLVLFGPSGAGKTVLLRLIAGVIDADAGAVLIDGRDMFDAEPEERGIGMAFQNFALFPHMNAFENIASPLTAKKLGADSIRSGVEAVARLLKIDHVLSHAPRELSNGQKQRTALARALAASPKLLLLDDPLRNVDAKLRFEMRLELPRLLREQGASVVYVTQDYKEAMALGDQIAVLSEGAVAQYGSPEEIYLRPSSIAIARLFGDPAINLLDSVAKAHPQGTAVQVCGVELILDSVHRDGSARGSAGQLQLDTQCVLGIRPEFLRFCTAQQPASIPVRVEVETPLNEKIVTLVSTHDGRELLVSRPADAPGPTTDETFVAIDLSRVLLFERSAGHLLRTTDATMAQEEDTQ